MLNDILRLTRIHLKGSLRISEGFLSSDRRKKKRSLESIASYLILGTLLIGLVTLVSNLMAGAGYAAEIPALIAVFASIVIFILTVFKAGTTVFNVKLFEAEIPLPLKPFQIVASRFLLLYTLNLAVATVIMVPGLLVCGLNMTISPVFVILSVIGVLLLPLIPLTLSIILGTILYGISSRMKHRKIVTVVLGLSMMVLVFILYFIFVTSNAGNAGSLSSNIADFISINFSALTGWYIPGTLFSHGLLGEILSFIYYAGLSIGLYVALLLFVSWKYSSICQAMQLIREVDCNYVLQEQAVHSCRKAMFIRDFKRYISSTPYLFNTLFGYILMIVLAIAVLSNGGAALGEMFGNSSALKMLCPLALAALISVSATTSASISIEGKTWWMMQTFPVTAKDLFSSKLNVNYAVALPFYLVSETILLIALRPSGFEAFAILLLPLAYLYFISVFDLNLGVRHPNFTWESEIDAVKQIVPLLLSILIAMGSLTIALILVVLTIGLHIWWITPLTLCIFSAIMFLLGFLIRRKLNRIEIIDIE